jgi:hypothetical protein
VPVVVVPVLVLVLLALAGARIWVSRARIAAILACIAATCAGVSLVA